MNHRRVNGIVKRIILNRHKLKHYRAIFFLAVYDFFRFVVDSLVAICSLIDFWRENSKVIVRDGDAECALGERARAAHARPAARCDMLAGR